MNHIAAVEAQNAGKQCPVALCRVKFYLVGKERFKQLYLFQRVNGTNAVPLLQSFGEQVPKNGIILVGQRSAFLSANVQASILRLSVFALAQFRKRQRVAQIDRRGHVARFERCPGAVEPIERFFRGLAVIDVRRGLIRQLPVPLSEIVFGGGMEHLARKHRRGLVAQQQSAVSQPAVAFHGCRVAARAVGRQQTDEFLVVVNQQRSVFKTVAVVLHKVAAKQERAVARSSRESVPGLSGRPIIYIWSNGYHLLSIISRRVYK